MRQDLRQEAAWGIGADAPATGMGDGVYVRRRTESAVEYRYTADGRLAWRDRTSDAVSGAWLLYDGGQVIAEQSASERQSWSVWSGGSVVQWRGKLAPNGSVDTLHLHQDRIGSVVSGTRWNGAEEKTEVWMQRQFDPYGRRVVSIGWERNEPEQPYGFAGQRWDAETGLYLMGARWYSAELGRFIEQDPIAEGGGLNLYAYVGSSPTLWVDPSGLKPAELDQPPGIPGGNGASNTLDQPKYSIDGVSAVDPVTGGPLGKRVEGALKASELAQEVSDWSSERKLAKAFAKAKVGSDSSVVFNVRVLDGAVSVTMNERALEGERDQVTTLPDATEAPELGAIEEGISVDFGRDLGGIEAKGTEAFLESVATHLGTIKSTATGNIALSELSRLEGSTTIMRTEGRTQVDLGRSHGADRVIAFNERGSRGSSSLNRNGLIEAIPLDVGLFHEVLHTYHERKGDEAQGSYSGANPLLRNSDGAGTLNWELQVIGLDRWRASGLTENAYRRDRGVSERVSHFSGEVLRRRGVIR